jgi:hypothetical protein
MLTDGTIGCEAKANRATTLRSPTKIFVVASVLSPLAAALVSSLPYRWVLAQQMPTVLLLQLRAFLLASFRLATALPAS